MNAPLPPRLSATFKDNFGLDEHQLITVAENFKAVSIGKAEFYLKQGAVAKSKAYVAKGAFRYFYTDDNLKENTLFFRFEDSWLGDVESYHQRTPSKVNIQAIEDAELLVITQTDFDALQKRFPTLERWYAVNAVKMYVALFNKLVEAKLRRAEEKYLHMLEYEPEVLRRVPLQQIATYLEIEPQSLSRIRRRISKSGE